MNKISEFLKKIANILLLSLKRFPETILISTGFVIIMIINNHLYSNDNVVLTKLGFVLALGIPLSCCLLLVQERFKSLFLFRIIGILLLLLYGTVFFRLIPMDLTDKFTIRYAFVSAIFYLLFSLIPYLANRENYGLYVIKLVTSFFVTYLYTLVLYLGIIAIIFTIDQLFALNINSEIYFDTFIIAVGIFGLTYFLGRVPKLSDDLKDYNYPTVLRVLFVSIIMPLVSVYTVVLYAYLIRIIFTLTWPKGIVSHLVTWYGFISIFLLIIIEPLIPTSSWTTKFRKYLPLAILVPFIMLIISIMIRINAYGITISRYLVVAAWVWLLSSALFLIVKKKGSTQYLIISFIIIFTIAMFSPVNGFKISIHSQVNRLENILEMNNMLKNNEITPNENSDDNLKRNISSILDYLDRENGLENVSSLPEDFNLKDMNIIFGFPYDNGYYLEQKLTTSVDFSYLEPNLVAIADYNYHVLIRSFYENNSTLNMDDVIIEFNPDSITILKGENIIQMIEIVSLLDENKVDINSEFKSVDAPIILTKTYANLKIMIVIYELHGQMNEDVLELNYYEGDMYFSIIE